MSQITINTISGTSPYDIYVCDINQIYCELALTGVTAVPPSINLTIPSAFTYSPIVLIKIIDSSGCTTTETYSCVSQTPTPSVTSTPSVTPTNTSTTTQTPTPTVTSGTPTPTPSVTTSLTPTQTPTTTPTPSPMVRTNVAWLFVEPISGATEIGNYMYNQSLNFLGFSNGTSPSDDPIEFQKEMNAYINFSGWSINFLRTGSLVSNSNIGFDLSGNPQVIGNFQTLTVNKNTIGGPAWYTFIISSGLTNGLYQKRIDVSEGELHSFNAIKTDSLVYSRGFSYTGSTYQKTTYRVYTTFPSTEFLFDNSSTTLYFKGNSIGT